MCVRSYNRPPHEQVRTVSTDWREYIESTPEVLRGKPRLKGTRISVSLILGHLAANESIDDIVRQFPDLNSDHIAACLEYARDLRRSGETKFDLPQLSRLWWRMLRAVYLERTGPSEFKSPIAEVVGSR